MLEYRFLERYTPSRKGWVRFGVAYQDSTGRVLLFVPAWRSPKVLRVPSLWELSEDHYPQTPDEFHWSSDAPYRWRTDDASFSPIEVMFPALQFFWLLDCSGSMRGPMLTTLNRAIGEARRAIRDTFAWHQEVQIMMRAIKFADTASWHIGPKAVALEEWTEWPALDAQGDTAIAQAIRLLATALTQEKMPYWGCPPVCILVSDGYPTDPPAEYDRAINALLALPWGKQAVRLAIAVGNEADSDETALRKFVSDQNGGMLKARSPEELVRHIKWASVTALTIAVQSKSTLDSDPPVLSLPTPVSAPSADGDL